MTVPVSVQEGDLPLEGEKRVMSVEPPRPVQTGDLPLEGSAGQVLEVQSGDASSASSRGPSTNPSSKKARWVAPAFALLVIVSLALVIGLSVGLTQANSGEAKITAKEKQAREWLIASGFSEASAFENPSSPQNLAVRFMAEGSYDIKEGISWIERYVLSVFYYAMNGPEWKYQFEFHEQSLPTCTWYQNVQFSGISIAFGASCDDIGRVNSLQIFDHDLVGSIPSELGLLSEIEYLVLQRSLLKNRLPESLMNLRKLRYVDLVNCVGLTGTIPEWISEWSKATALGLTGNKLTGTLPTSLIQMTQLQALALDENLLTGGLAVLESLTDLDNLYVENNGFEDTIGGDFLNGLEKLRKLDISGNKLSGQVPVHLMAKPDIEVMDVSHNFLTSFPDTIPANSTLQFLSIHDNPFDSQPFPASIVNLKTLTHLDISSTGFTGTMPIDVAQLTFLRYLFMADTSFDPGPIPDGYQYLQQLRDFSLKASSRTGTIPLWIEDLDRMVLLDLDSNELTGSIPEIIYDMLSLEFLLLNRNRLNGTVPPYLDDARSIQILWLDHNNFTGDLKPFCEKARYLISASADCGGDPPQVTCDCCEFCCDKSSDEPCNDQDRLAQYDPQWEDGFSRGGFYDFREDFNITRL